MLAPDPAPHTGSAPVTYVAYDYAVPGVIPGTIRVIPGVWFYCHVSATGRRTCVRFVG